VVEDNHFDVYLIREALDGAKVDAEMDVVSDGELAISHFQQLQGSNAPCPTLVILDINLPKRNGFEVLAEIRHCLRCADVPVLVFTSADLAQDRQEMSKLGISGYFRKPTEYAEFMKLGEIVKGLLEH
jgi:CheY-like chemotaxis protein